MPSKKSTPPKTTRKPQPTIKAAIPKPETVAKAPVVVPEVVAAPSALFDPPAPAAPAVVPALETAASGGPPANPFKSTRVAAPQGERGGDVKATVPTAPVAAVAEVPIAPPPAVEAEPVLEPAAPAPIVETSDEPTTVRLGVVTATLRRMPLGEVLTHMDTFMSKLAAVGETKSVLDLQPRMLATEGRCAPIYFIGDPDDAEPEYLFDGIEAVAAAVALDLATVSVVIIAPGDAGAAQNHLAAHRIAHKPKDPEADLLLHVQAYQLVEPPASPAQ